MYQELKECFCTEPKTTNLYFRKSLKKVGLETALADISLVIIKYNFNAALINSFLINNGLNYHV